MLPLTLPLPDALVEPEVPVEPFDPVAGAAVDPDELLDPVDGAAVGAAVVPPLLVALDPLVAPDEPLTAVGALVVDPEVVGATAERGVKRYQASAAMMSTAMMMPTITPAPYPPPPVLL